MTLRRALVSAGIVLAITSLVACIALMMFTTWLRETTDDVIHIGELSAATNDLANHAMALPFQSSSQAHALAVAEGRALLARAEAAARSDSEREPFERISGELDQLWQSPAGTLPSADLILALHLSEQSFGRRAHAAQVRARALDNTADLLGIMLAALLGAGVIFTIWWVHYFVSKPLGSLATSVDRFAHGELSARASETGTSELRQLARTHNQMADAVASTRLDQLQYVATVVHDLRSPIAALQLVTGYVVPGKPLPPESRMRELFTVISRQLRRMSAIVGDVLGAVQADSGSIVLRLERCNAEQLARECIEIFETMAPGYRFELAVTGPTNLRADPRRFEQVVNNLLSNAVKYSPSGSRVKIEISGEDDSLVVSVTDEGPGIPPDLRDQLFRPFSRGKTGHEEIPGVGLGLYVSRRIVEAHGGTIDVRSVLGEGSTFTLKLPRGVEPA